MLEKETSLKIHTGKNLSEQISATTKRNPSIKPCKLCFTIPAPSGPPQNLRAITNSSSSIMLYWNPPKPAEQNGEITSYSIHISSSSAPEQARQVNTTTNATAVLITGLQAYTNYSFMVQAVNAGGVGPYSSVVANKTFEAGKLLSNKKPYGPGIVAMVMLPRQPESLNLV